MTENESRPQGGALAGNGLIVVALVMTGAAFIYREAPLLPSRPSSSEMAIREAAPQADARLWQDPFSAIAQARNAKSECTRALPAGSSPKLDADTIPLVVTVSGGPNYDDSEYRRRLRYAVIAGLDRAGFRPHDPRHLGYFSSIFLRIRWLMA
ncbi:hypothetical protein MSC49_41110 (plasmid) [Methylosinus sp. C49]|uniref:hypothetical protein n=1 Tax=Methylosinus sp. C49 TaxID=2699395 RepID=UPI001366C375|nr:hypothetical protein [Methylosinus sp. C49]BBU64176.1 hypothetical protein MSC49_41110 [Methylosinus sp. C49]